MLSFVRGVSGAGGGAVPTSAPMDALRPTCPSPILRPPWSLHVNKRSGHTRIGRLVLYNEMGWITGHVDCITCTEPLYTTIPQGVRTNYIHNHSQTRIFRAHMVVCRRSSNTQALRCGESRQKQDKSKSMYHLTLTVRRSFAG